MNISFKDAESIRRDPVAYMFRCFLGLLIGGLLGLVVNAIWYG
jgi:hypothetical protein